MLERLESDENESQGERQMAVLDLNQAKQELRREKGQLQLQQQKPIVPSTLTPDPTGVVTLPSSAPIPVSDEDDDLFGE